MGNERRVWKEVEVIPLQVLARGALVRNRLDLTNCLPPAQPRAIIKVGRTGTTALSVAPSLRTNYLFDRGQSDPFTDPRLGDISPLSAVALGGTTAAVSTTIAADAPAGQNQITLALVTGFAAGDIICIQDGGGGLSRVEWNVISKIAGSVLTLSGNLRYAHAASQNDVVTNQAAVTLVTSASVILNGAFGELVIDYGAPTTGESLLVHGFIQYPTFNEGLF